MQLCLQVMTPDCAPVAGGRVYGRHCDAQGVYSGGRSLAAGTNTIGQTLLCGTQTTASAGVATFQIVFPGWYSGRTTHVHYKVYLADKTVSIRRRQQLWCFTVPVVFPAHHFCWSAALLQNSGRRGVTSWTHAVRRAA